MVGAGADLRAAVKGRAGVSEVRPPWGFVQTSHPPREGGLSWVHCKVPAASIKLLAY